MRLTLATPAVVLRCWPYGESDKIVCLLTEKYGKVTGIAKGAKRSRRRFANSLEPFSLVNLCFYDRPQAGLVFILSAELTRTFKHLAASLEKITLASYVTELTDGLTSERDHNMLVFKLLIEALTFLDKDGSEPLQFLASFELKLLSLAGYRPVLDRCVGCTRKHTGLVATPWHFSPAEGGILCGICARSRSQTLSVRDPVLEALTKLQREAHSDAAEVSPFPPEILKEIRFVIQRFLQIRLIREIRSAAFISAFVGV